MHAMTLATTCGHAWSAQCVIIVAPMSARHGYITADWSHPFADPDAAARQPSPAPKRRRLGRHSFRPATARSELAGNYGIGSNKRKWINAGVDARIQDLRHTTGSRTLRKTGNLKVVQTLLGHSTIAITAEFYANVTVEDVRAAMEATAAAELPAIELKKDGEK
jgi:hypothetical protein